LTANQEPLISVIIPCYNAEKFIGECIQSALDQRYANKEIIVVDDCSEDGSLDVIKSFGERVTIYAGQKYGAPEARNFGAKKSRGALLQFFDSDDLMLPGKLEKQASLLLAEGGDFTACQCQGFGEGIELHDGPKVTEVPEGRDPYSYVNENVFLQTGNPLHR